MEKIKNIAFVKKHPKFIKFFMTGVFNTLVDIAIYSTLANVVHLPQVLANIISTTICTGISFYLNEKFVWKSAKSRKETAPKFLAVTLFSAYVIQTIVINLAILSFNSGLTADVFAWISGICGMETKNIVNIFAKLAACGCGMISNYFGYKIVFTSRQSEEEQ